jgi:UDP-N-acetyl-2-amino-2-deoxyglucuronate dehydrogenase
VAGPYQVRQGAVDLKNFAMTGVSGFVAPRHLKAIHDTGNRLVAAADPHDAVGILDQYSFDVRFFTEIERFDRHLEKLRRGPEPERENFLSICSPNYLHDAHIRLALRSGADAICEKPLVINPWNLDALQEIERETGRRVHTVLQLRCHPDLVSLKAKLDAEPADRKHEVTLSYITARGRWYAVSWKGSEERSGGVVTNIGIHFFDLLLWLFGRVEMCEVNLRQPHRAAGYFELERAAVRWFLSTDPFDLPPESASQGRKTFRSIQVDGTELEFSEGFVDLHTKVYEQVLQGRGHGIEDARPSIALAHQIRHALVTTSPTAPHPRLLPALS